MRILLVTHYFSTHGGGIEIVAHRIAERLAADPGIDIEWMASDCDAPPKDLPAGVRCVPARSWNGMERRFGLPYPVWHPAAVRDLHRAVQECDVVHLHDSLYFGNLLAFLFARRLGKPVFVTQHVGAIPYRSRALRALLSCLNRTVARAVLQGAEGVFFISPAVQRYFERFSRFRAAPVYVANGVDGALYEYADAARVEQAKRALGRDPARPVCLFVGRFVQRKGVDRVLALARELTNVDWILAGDGPLDPESAGLANVTVLRGRSGHEIAALYRVADLLVLPSVGEGFPLVVQEAMACGTPALVSTETALGCPRAAPLLFTERVEGEDAPMRWRGRIRSLLGEPGALSSLRERVAAAARAEWSWDAAAARYRDAIRTSTPPPD
jgi:glycosyltransferase involved in cell wall biosynthesis